MTNYEPRGKPCGTCGAWMDDTGQSGFVCPTPNCVNSWRGTTTPTEVEPLQGRAAAIAREVSYVAAGPPIGRRDDWLFIIDSLIGGLETYEGVVKWLAIWPDLDTAYAEALKLRDGMIAS